MFYRYPINDAHIHLFDPKDMDECIAMVDEHAGENEGAAETAETLDETSPSSGVAGVSGVSTERVPQRREQDSMSCSPKRGLSERIEIPETPTGKGGLA